MGAQNLIISPHQQGTEEWLKDRLGVITASEVHALLLDERTKKYKKARNTYMNKLISEVCTGYFKEINAKPLQWGKDNEDAAIAAYEFATGNQTEKIGLVYKDESRRAAASADFRLVGAKCGGEVKNPIDPSHHINFIFDNEIKPEYISQYQYGMWIFEWDEWVFGSHQPLMKKKNFHHITEKRDEALMSYFDFEIPKFIAEMDKKLAQIGIPFGNQWL